MAKVGSNIILVVVSLAIIITIGGLIVYKIHIKQCDQVKADFIHKNLPSEYGPTTPIEKRIEDTKRINAVYYGCLYPWR